jgi:hypothetical protein
MTYPVMTDSDCRIRTAAPIGRNHRVSPQSAWPLRNSDGLTFAEAKRLREEQNK